MDTQQLCPTCVGQNYAISAQIFHNLSMTAWSLLGMKEGKTQALSQGEMELAEGLYYLSSVTV